MTSVHNSPAQNRNSESSQLPSPELMLASARETYRAYCQIHSEAQPPVGVAMDRNTGRGQLIFSEHPILLPHEYFISVDQMQQAATAPPNAVDVKPTEFQTTDFQTTDFQTVDFRSTDFQITQR